MTNMGNGEPSKASQLLILGSYTALAFVLIAETLLLSWEPWAVPLVLVGVATCWVVHVRQILSGAQRLWVYAAIMMATFFFYGVHLTSAYDMALVMVIGMLIFTSARKESLITLCQVTYYVTLLYDLAMMAAVGTEWTVLLVTRTGLHVALVFLAGVLGRSTIRQWDQMFAESDERISMLDSTAKRMNAFMANLSHELRTPINAIQGMANVLLGQELSAETRRSLLTVRDAGNRMGEQVSDIMDYSELEMGNLVVNPETYMLSSLFNDLITELRPRVSPDVELVVDVDVNIPSTMVCDVGKLRKILFHIIGNALKYTREGGVYVHAMCMPREYGINLCVEVTDTGIGMTQDEIEQVSQRFYQANSGKFVYTGGLGLGLPIVYGMVRALGGFLVLDSEPGRGTTVRVSVPQQVVDERACMSVAHPDRVRAGAFLDMGRFADQRVREFYDAMIFNMVRGLDVMLHRVGSTDDLEKLDARIKLTHLFVGEDEYLCATDYLEELAGRMLVIVVAGEHFSLRSGSLAHLLPKPFYSMPFASVLNSGVRATGGHTKRISCPGVRALVVDDEPMNLNVARGILRRYGMAVTTATSGPEAIRMCEDFSFDVVFMDHMMPGMDGVEAMKRIRSLSEAMHRELPIVALTANALSSAREMFMAEGFDGFVSKPIDIPELERVLRRVLPASALTYAPEDGEQQGAFPPAKPEEDMARADVPSEADATAVLEAGGVKTEVGLRYCQGDVPFYRSLLRQFQSDHAQKRAGLSHYLEGEDWESYAIVVHALKSTAALIGAEALSGKAKGLEEAAKEADGRYVRAHHGDLIASYDSTVGLIAEALGDDGADTFVDPSSGYDLRDKGDDDALEFAPADDDVLEFAPEVGSADDEVLEFAPADDEVLEFDPEGELASDEVFEFAPEEEG